MNQLVFLFIFLLCIGFSGCSGASDAEREKMRSAIQAQLDAQYPDMGLTVEGVSRSFGSTDIVYWDRYAFRVKDKTGLDFWHYWYDNEKKLAPRLREAHKKASRLREIREGLRAALPSWLQTVVYVGVNERDIHIFCMSALTADNKDAVIEALRATLDQADTELHMGGYAVQVLFTRQGSGASGPPPYGYDDYLGVVLFPGQGTACFQLAGQYTDDVIQPAIKAKAKEIADREGWSIDTVIKFFQINQEDFSEIFVGVDLEREDERDTTCLYMIFDTESLELNEYSIMSMPHVEGDTQQSRYAAWREMIPSRFRCPNQAEKPKVQVVHSWWWDVR